MILVNGKNDSGYTDHDIEDIMEEKEFTLTLSPVEYEKVKEYVEDIKTRNVEIKDAKHANCECVKPIFTIVGVNGALVIPDSIVSSIGDNNTVTYSLGNNRFFYKERKDLNSPIVIEEMPFFSSVFTEYKITIRD